MRALLTLWLALAAVDVRSADVDGTTALHRAVDAQDLPQVVALLKRGANPNSRNDYGATPMTVAAEQGSFPIMQALLRAGGDMESANGEGQTLLMAVARTGRTDTARLLLDRGANVNAKENWGGQTALMWAAAQQQPAMIRLLLKRGAEVNARGKDQDWPRWVTSEPRIKPLETGGFTPLLYAVREGCRDCVTALLDGGADINQADPWGQTPLLMATLNLHYDISALLIARGADIGRWDWWGRTALYNCIDLHLPSNTSRGDLPSAEQLTALDVARTLLAKGAYVNMRLKHEPPFRGGAGDRGYTDGTADSRVVSAGSTALHKAAKAGDLDAVKLLLQYKARTDIANIMYEVTPILAAGGVWRVYGIFKDQPLSGQFTTGAKAAEIVKLLMDSGANIQDYASNGQNIAHGAAKAGWNEVLQLAWDHGVNFEAKDVGGLTPRDLAQMKGRTETVQLIDKLLGNRPRETGKVVVGDTLTADAIAALLPLGVTVSTATADQMAQAAAMLAFNAEGNLESNIAQTMLVLGEMTRQGKIQNAPRYGEGASTGRFYLKVMNMASSNLDVSSKTYYGLSTLDLTRIAAAARAGQNALNGAKSDAITRKKD